MALEKLIDRVPVYTELDRPEERIYAIQRLYKQILNIMDTIEGGGGGGSVPGPNTVGSEQVVDNSLQEQDLNDSVKAGLHELEDEENYAQHNDIDSIFK